MASKSLFLLGGPAGLDAFAKEFIKCAGGKDAAIALLTQGGEKQFQYVPQYTKLWAKFGATQYFAFMPQSSESLDYNLFQKILNKATAIFFGGGQTRIYQ